MSDSRAKVLYISGPATGRKWPKPLRKVEYLRNVLRAAKAGAEAMRRGWAVVIPQAMFMPTDLCYGRGLRWRHYMTAAIELLRRSDAMLYLRSSPGADIELAWAERHGMPVYRSVAEVPVVGDSGDNSLSRKAEALDHVLDEVGAPEWLRRLCEERMVRGHYQYDGEWLRPDWDWRAHAAEEIADLACYVALGMLRGQATEGDIKRLGAAVAAEGVRGC